MSSYANIPNIKEQTGWRVSFWVAVSSPLIVLVILLFGFDSTGQVKARRKNNYG